ncbi:MAG: hypothetical protein JW727_06900 [Candidatus Aenigmarchaeota archaeon]|nr:hypothetical protein [Candidatus Aenigmarchaeota archaeon]
MATLLPPGMVELVVPFALTFALVLGALNLSGVFKGQKQVNFIIGLAVALLASSSEEYSKMVLEWAPILATVMIVVFLVVFLKNMFGTEKKASWEMLVILALLFLVLLAVGPYLPLPSGSSIKSDDILLVGGILLVIGIIAIGARLKNEGFGGGS